MFNFLWAATAYCLIILKFRYPGFLKDMWKFREVNWTNMKPILLRWVLASIGMVIFIHIYDPEKAFNIVKERPEIIPMIMVFYPIMSAIPQELVFCSFFFKRYHRYFPTERAKIIASMLVFAYAHILYLNPVGPTLSLLAGYIFAQTYSKSRSLALVSIEHGLYGCTLFLSGLGYYFYSGAVAAP